MAIDITTSHYSDGTATVAGVNVIGQGTTWSKVRRGDRYGTHLGFGVRIAEVIDDTHLTLAYDVPGLYQSEAPYEIQRTPYDLGYLQAMQDLLSKLGNGNLEAFAALNGLTDKLPIFSGPGTLALISKLDLSSGLKSDGRAADQAGLAVFDGENSGFIVRVADYLDGRAALVEKLNDGAPGEWSEPSYVTGEEGGSGPYTDITFGPVTTLPAGTPAYAETELVEEGVIRIDLFVPAGADGEDGQDGQDGTGTGDMVGPANSADDEIVVYSGTTGKIVKRGGRTITQLLTSTVRVDAAQSLTPAEKGQARANIGVDVLAGLRNALINGNFDIWQRGTSFAAATGSRFTADRWRVSGTGSTLAVARTVFSPGITEAFGGFQFGAQATVVSSAGSGNFAFMAQKVEGVRRFAGKTVTVSLAGYANAAKNTAIELVQNFGSGGSPSSFVSVPAGLFAMTTELGKKTLTVDVPSIVGKTIGSNGDDSLELFIWFDAGSSFNTRASNLGQQSGTFTLAHVSIVEGDATAEVDPFSPRHTQQELALCQRYYWRLATPIFGSNYASAFSYRVAFPVTMRTVPAVTKEVDTGTFSTERLGVDGWSAYYTGTTLGALNDFRADAEL